jgi:hypothetical protein
MAHRSPSARVRAGSRILPAAVLAGLAALPAAATTLRVDVTGTLGWRYVHDSGLDADTGVLVPEGELAPADVPPGTPGFAYRDVAEATTGRFFYTTHDGTFSGCTGLMAMICGFSLSDPDVIASIAYDAAQDIFTGALAILPDGASLDIGPQSFVYTADYAFPDPAIGTTTYFQAFPLFKGTIETMTVTTVPLPAALPTLIAGLGALALLRRRAPTAPRPGQTRQRPSA